MNVPIIAIVSDEITRDFRGAARKAKSWGLSTLEVRTLRTGRIPLIEQSELSEVRDIISGEGLVISALSPGIFKCPLGENAQVRRDLEDTLPRTLEAARLLGTRLLIGFGFRKEEGEPPENALRAADILYAAASAAGREGISLAVENEPGTWCDSGSATARIIRQSGSLDMGVNWDPANAIGTGEQPYPDGYRAIREMVLNVHVKDTREGALRECVPLGTGVVAWKEQIAHLVADGRPGRLTVETHVEPLLENSRRSVETLRRWLAELSEKEHG